MLSWPRVPERQFKLLDRERLLENPRKGALPPRGSLLEVLDAYRVKGRCPHAAPF